MKFLNQKLILTYLVCAGLFITSCNNDDDNNSNPPPISNGTSVTVNNTFQSTAFNIPDEIHIEDFFMVPAQSLYATATVSNGLEFDNYLYNLYDIDIQENSINFTMAAQAGDPTYGANFRTIETGTTDRYYLNFESEHNVSSFTSNNTSVNLRIDSSTTLVVEIGEGFDFNPGISFTITLN